MTGAEHGVRGVRLAPDGWNYGDFPYGLEPLTLPHPDQDARSDPVAKPAVTTAYLDLAAVVRERGPTTEPATERDLEQMYWFRWITGHHVSFVLWRLMARQLRRLAGGDADRPATVALLVEYVRGYCGMLLYTGSCTRSIYEGVIRPSMYRLHRAFSGTWAPDYRPVRILLNGRRLRSVADPAAEQLARQVELSHRIHLGVAAKLVTDGRSLLQGLTEKQAAGPRQLRNSIFDCCFLTVRDPVSTEEIAMQLLRRVRAVAMDMVTNGLYPYRETAEEAPDELLHQAVTDCEIGLLDNLLRVAATVAGQPTGDAGPVRTG